MDWLREHRPDLIPRYERLYARGAYAPKAERERLAALAAAARARRPRTRADATRPDAGARERPDLPRSRSPPEQPVLRLDPRRYRPALSVPPDRLELAVSGGRTASNSPVSTSRSISCSISSSLSAGISPVSTWRRISRSRKRRNLRISSTSTR